MKLGKCKVILYCFVIQKPLKTLLEETVSAKVTIVEYILEHRELSSKLYKRLIIPFDHQSVLTEILVVFNLQMGYQPLSSQHTKVQASALQTFANVLNVDHKKNKRTRCLA